MAKEIQKKQDESGFEPEILENVMTGNSLANINRLASRMTKLAMRINLLEKEVESGNRELKNDERYIALKGRKRDLKDCRHAYKSVVDMFNGAVSQGLSDFMPGASLSAKLESLEAKHKELGGRQN
jgi:hypothetical protein